MNSKPHFDPSYTNEQRSPATHFGAGTSVLTHPDFHLTGPLFLSQALGSDATGDSGVPALQLPFLSPEVAPPPPPQQDKERSPAALAHLIATRAQSTAEWQRRSGTPQPTATLFYR